MGFSLTRAQKWSLFGVFFLVIAVYAQLLPVGKINWDDDSNIFKNPYYLLNMWRPFWTETYFGLYVPVTSMVWQLMFLIGGGAAWPYRVLNLTLHLANCYLAFRLLKSMAIRWNLPCGWALPAGVAMFALHPMQIHAVAWISGGRDLLAAFFGLLSIFIFFRNTTFKGIVISSVLFAAAVLSKPNVTVFPVLLPFLCYLCAKDKMPKAWTAAVLWALIIPASIFMTLYAQRDFLLSLKWWERLLIMGDTYSFYIQKLIFPYPLSANYDRIPEVILQTWQPVWRSAILAVGLALAYAWVKKTDKRFAIALSWFALLLPVSGLVAFGYQRISTTADHYHYLPMLAVSAVVVLWFNICPYWPKFAGKMALFMIVALGALSLWRVQVWKTDQAFFADMIAYAPESYSTGLGMSAVECEQNRNFPEGEKWAFVALNKRHNDVMVLANLAYCRFNSRQMKRAVELEAYLDQLDLAEQETKQPSALSSFLASVGSAMVEDGHLYDGYQLLCHSYRIKPSEPNNLQNIKVATEILKKAGINPICEGVLKYGKNRPLKAPDEDPARD